MLASKVKDLKARITFHKSEKQNLINKFIFINTLNKDKFSFCRTTHFFKTGLKNRMNTKTKIVRRCVFNNRGRGVIRPFGISRTYLRELLQFGQVPGFSKAIW